ncbi:MAG: NADH-quinone oxidoreductase subunit L [Candidatus Latescibacterota bacterium]|nr:MAG: NADH-quinone oxidoreductase subunit L [Candidatus Latescibacterota bacterium]
MREFGLLKAILLLPLAGAIWNGFFGKWVQRRFGEKPISIVATAAAAGSFLVSLVSVLALRSADGALADRIYTWFSAGDLSVPVALLLDPLSSVMILVVTGVGSLIHVYSIGYMHGDGGYYRYFAFLNLFLFSMLTLVLGDNILLLFVGWEGVGLCSYLLIGFWFTDREKAAAGMKAFLTNRIGDLGFIVGVFALWWLFAGKGVHSLAFADMARSIRLIEGETVLGAPALAFIGIALFVGAAGKSAQIPLYVWLPDAMAGPTPVSALIHAATMVTAGVYMIARMHFLYTLAPAALAVVAIVGAATALFAATIGIAQTDIKKVLAYSTVSQLGYMMIGVGVGAYAAGIFHLMTHAFFKACLFLSAGSVIHAMGGEQDIRKMGGLRKKMPLTFLSMFLATLAIAGIPGFSGFFSKDEILWNAWAGPHGHPLLWAAGALGAGITAFYMFRLVFLAFFGECRASEETKHHLHESPRVVTTPLLALAALSVAGGWVGIPEALGGKSRFHHFLAGVFSPGGAHGEAIAHGEQAVHASRSLEYLLMAASVLIALGGIALAHRLYLARPDLPGRIVSRARLLHRIVENKYYVDEIYRATVIRFVLVLSRALRVFDDFVVDGVVNLSGWVVRIVALVSGWFDNTFVDGLVNAVSNGTIALGARARRLQTGAVQSYVIAVFAGILLLVLLYMGLSGRA